MKLIKRRTKISYKPITDLQWHEAYSKYLLICIFKPKGYDAKDYYVCGSLEEFKTFAANIYHPLPEVDQPVETEQEFVARVTKTDSKSDKYVDIQFISNSWGEIVSCVLY